MWALTGGPVLAQGLGRRQCGGCSEGGRGGGLALPLLLAAHLGPVGAVGMAALAAARQEQHPARARSEAAAQRRGRSTRHSK